MISMSYLDEFLCNGKNQTQSNIIDIVREITGIEFDQSHPMRSFYTMPASTKFHGCFQGGLAIHSLRVYYCARLLAQAFGYQEEDIDANACIFHDLVKTDSYKWDAFTSTYRYNYDTVSLPHGSESVLRMHKYNIPISSKGWELAIAYHMGAFEHDNMSAYSNACDKYKEVLLLHTADMMATKIYKQ